MTLNKIISIKNIGRFLNYSAAGDVTLKVQNLVFAENGRGKTTLCAILRSLQSHEPAYILGRKTLGCSDEPEVKLLFEGGQINFKNGAWDKPTPNLSIFDDTYVSENVYVGEVVDTEQRRNLYRIIIGYQGVEIANVFQKLDDQIRRKTEAISRASETIQRYVPDGMKVDDFISLAEDDDIDKKIAAKHLQLDAVRKADQIEQREGFSTVPLPMLPVNFSELLSKTIPGIIVGVEQRIADHIHAHYMEENGEPWLSKGLAYIADDKCPFCDQDIKGISLIRDYQTYFGETYHTLKEEIGTKITEFNDQFDAAAITSILRIFEKNDHVLMFWKDYCAFQAPAFEPISEISAVMEAMWSSGISFLNRKNATPLDALSVDENFERVNASFETLINNITAYNRMVLSANKQIEKVKEQTDATDVATVEAELSLLNAQKMRHTQKVNIDCKAYKNLLADKKDLERQKETSRSQLDQHTETVIKEYGQSINRYLELFNTGFQIVGPTYDYRGRIPSSRYKILINETPVELGGLDTPLSEPSFKNTLSSGDRRTLALAFFFAQLEQDPNRAQKIVVLDDPFTSQDAFRRTQTTMEIKRCGEGCAQILLLSHDPHFLKRLWDLLPPADRKMLQFVRIGEINTTIAECEIDEIVKSHYQSDVETLQRYYSNSEGDARDVVQKIRPVLEGYCYNLYPNQFSDSDALGIMIGKIRQAGNAHPLFSLCNELEDLNEYTKRYHHGENPNAATEPIDDNELAGYVKRTLTVAGNLI